MPQHNLNHIVTSWDDEESVTVAVSASGPRVVSEMENKQGCLSLNVRD